MSAPNGGGNAFEQDVPPQYGNPYPDPIDGDAQNDYLALAQNAYETAQASFQSNDLQTPRLTDSLSIHPDQYSVAAPQGLSQYDWQYQSAQNSLDPIHQAPIPHFNLPDSGWNNDFLDPALSSASGVESYPSLHPDPHQQQLPVRGFAMLGAGALTGTVPMVNGNLAPQLSNPLARVPDFGAPVPANPHATAAVASTPRIADSTATLVDSAGELATNNDELGEDGQEKSGDIGGMPLFQDLGRVQDVDLGDRGKRHHVPHIIPVFTSQVKMDFQGHEEELETFGHLLHVTKTCEAGRNYARDLKLKGEALESDHPNSRDPGARGSKQNLPLDMRTPLYDAITARIRTPARKAASQVSSPRAFEDQVSRRRNEAEDLINDEWSKLFLTKEGVDRALLYLGLPEDNKGKAKKSKTRRAKPKQSKLRKRKAMDTPAEDEGLPAAKK